MRDLLGGSASADACPEKRADLHPARACQRVAAKIPGAEFRPSTDPNFEQWAELIRAFLMPSAAAASPDVPGATGTAVILFTDIVSTRRS